MKTIAIIFNTTIYWVIFFICASKLIAQCPDTPTSAELYTLEQCNIDPSSLFTPSVSPRCTIKETEKWRIIKSNGIPEHEIGVFGTVRVRPCGRPSELKEQDFEWRIPSRSGITKLGIKKYVPLEIPKIFGVAINGIPFDPEAAEWYKCDERKDWQKSALNHPDMKYDTDCNNAHIQPTGAYHYHGLPKGLYEKEGGTYPMPEGSPYELTHRKTVQLGWALDGAPIYGPLCYRKPTNLSVTDWWHPKSGWMVKEKPTSPPVYCEPIDAYNGYYDEDYEYKDGEGTLDNCNGHFTPTPDYPDGIYHYHITLDYPHIPRCFTKNVITID